MIWSVLPPTRRAVPFRRDDPKRGREAVRAFFSGRDVRLFESGTQSLAAALVHARAHAAARGQVNDPEAIIPAYGCPDLVSACVQAKVRPKLVDVSREGWGFDLERLAESLSPRTVAIVAVNLLGAGDSAPALLPLARQHGAFLIQDSAQHLPRRSQSWVGDCVVFSFGRGKPMNLLRGGALVLPAGATKAEIETVPASGGLKRAVLDSRLGAALFNVVTLPLVYGGIARLPGMGLGETHYKVPAGIAELSFETWGQVGAALEEYGARASYDASVWAPALKVLNELGVRVLRAADGSDPSAEPLRLALLARDTTTRDRLIEALNREGLGATAMYAVALNRVAGVPEDVRAQGPFPNAESLASRLLTLPTHRHVTSRHARRAADCAKRLLRAEIKA